MAPILTFGLFTIISRVENKNSLLVAKAFTSLTVLSLLGTPLVMFVQTLPMLVAAVASFSRIQEFLTSQTSAHRIALESKSYLPYVPIGPSGSNYQPPVSLTILKPGTDVYCVANGSFGWTEGTPVLRNIDVNIPKSKFAAVVGPVGSGKSTLLKALLGETATSEGVVSKPSSPIAFCDQNTWTINSTLRANIIGPSEFDGPWYETVLHACALKDDLQALPGGDQCLLGSKGISLSGGQKQRVVSLSDIESQSSNCSDLPRQLPELYMLGHQWLCLMMCSPDWMPKPKNTFFNKCLGRREYCVNVRLQWFW